MIKRTIFISIIIFISVKLNAERVYYERAYSKIEDMLLGRTIIDFKKAVYITENAFFNEQLKNDVFEDFILSYAFITEGIKASGDITYTESVWCFIN